MHQWDSNFFHNEIRILMSIPLFYPLFFYFIFLSLVPFPLLFFLLIIFLSFLFFPSSIVYMRVLPTCVGVFWNLNCFQLNSFLLISSLFYSKIFVEIHKNVSSRWQLFLRKIQISRFISLFPSFYFFFFLLLFF